MGQFHALYILCTFKIIIIICMDIYNLSHITGAGSVEVQGSLLFVTYTIIQGIISSEMLVRTGPLNGKCKKIKIIIG